jgi:hypothetical protein
MMKAFLVMLISGLALPTFSAPTNSAVSVSIALPYARNRLAAFGASADTNDTRVLCRSWDTSFCVVLRNISDKPQNLWQEENSWGYHALHFELKEDSGRTWVAKKVDAGFYQNGPMFWTLKPKEPLVMKVSLDDRQVSDWQKWKGFPHRQTVSVRAVYEVGEDAYTRKYGVWTGRVDSDWYRIYFAD